MRQPVTKKRFALAGKRFALAGLALAGQALAGLALVGVAGCTGSDADAIKVLAPGSAAAPQVAAPEVGYEYAVSAVMKQCIAAAETGTFDATALRGAGFVNSAYNSEEFQVRLSGAQAGQSFSVAFPSRGQDGCRVLTRYPNIAPQIAISTASALRASGYAVADGTSKSYVAQKQGRILSVSRSESYATSIPFYELSIAPAN